MAIKPHEHKFEKWGPWKEFGAEHTRMSRCSVKGCDKRKHEEKPHDYQTTYTKLNRSIHDAIRKCRQCKRAITKPVRCGKYERKGWCEIPGCRN